MNWSLKFGACWRNGRASTEDSCAAAQATHLPHRKHRNLITGVEHRSITGVQDATTKESNMATAKRIKRQCGDDDGCDLLDLLDPDLDLPNLCLKDGVGVLWPVLWP